VASVVADLAALGAAAAAVVAAREDVSDE